MSVSHLLIPYSAEFETDKFRRWYKKAIPNDLRYGRLPNIVELKTVLENYLPEGYKLFEFSSSLMVAMSLDSKIDNHALVSVDITGLNSGNIQYSFGGDRFHLTEIIKKLPYDCGSYLLITNGENPEFITAIDF